MFLKIILPALLAITLSCIKEEQPASYKQLLIHQGWILASYGYDENDDGFIDASEENIRDCEIDNRYNFFAGGKGLFEENDLSCGNGITEMNFTWEFSAGERAIGFNNGIAKIHRLTAAELVLSQETKNSLGRPVQLFTVFRH